MIRENKKGYAFFIELVLVLVILLIFLSGFFESKQTVFEYKQQEDLREIGYQTLKNLDETGVINTSLTSYNFTELQVHLEQSLPEEVDFSIEYYNETHTTRATCTGTYHIFIGESETSSTFAPDLETKEISLPEFPGVGLVTIDIEHRGEYTAADIDKLALKGLVAESQPDSVKNQDGVDIRSEVLAEDGNSADVLKKTIQANFTWLNPLTTPTLVMRARESQEESAKLTACTAVSPPSMDNGCSNAIGPPHPQEPCSNHDPLVFQDGTYCYTNEGACNAADPNEICGDYTAPAPAASDPCNDDSVCCGFEEDCSVPTYCYWYLNGTSVAQGCQNQNAATNQSNLKEVLFNDSGSYFTLNQSNLDPGTKIDYVGTTAIGTINSTLDSVTNYIVSPGGLELWSVSEGDPININLTGTGNLEIHDGTNASMISVSAGTITVTSSLSQGQLNVSGGTFETGSAYVSFDTISTHATGVINSNPSNPIVLTGGTWDTTDGGFSHGNGNVTFTASTVVSTVNNNDFYDVSTTNDVTQLTNMTVDNFLTVSGNIWDTYNKSLIVTGQINLSNKFQGRNGSHTFGKMVVNSGGTYNATNSTTNITGDFINDGTFIHSNGTVNFVGTGTQDVYSNDVILYDVEVYPRSGALWIYEHLNVNHSLKLNDDISVRAATPDVVITLGAGAVVSGSGGFTTSADSFDLNGSSGSNLSVISTTGGFDLGGYTVRMRWINYTTVLTTGGSADVIQLEDDVVFEGINLLASARMNITNDAVVNISRNVTLSPTSNITFTKGTTYNLSINSTNVTYLNGSNIVVQNLLETPTDNNGFNNISVYMNITNLTAGGIAIINISYDENKIGALDEKFLQLFRYDGTSWQALANTTVDTAANIIYGNITQFSGVGGGGYGNASRWSSTNQNTSTPDIGDPVNLTAVAWDDYGVDYAILETNETGSWENKTLNYSSPYDMGDVTTPTRVNFQWRNSSVGADTVVGWRIWFNDTHNNWNVTNTTTFTMQGPDTTLPNASNIVKNESTVNYNENVMFNSTWLDDTGLSWWIFSWNASGSWKNISNSSFSGVNSTASTVQNVTAAEGTYVGWRFYANDTTNNWNSTEIQTFTVAAPIDDNIPKWYDPINNDSSIQSGDYVEFNANWTDNSGLSSWKFEWNDSGSWVNDSAGTFSGVTANSTFAVLTSAAEQIHVGWRFWANDTSNNWNVTDTQTYTVAMSVPTGESPLKNDSTVEQNDHVLFTTDWSDDSLLSAWNFSWNDSGSWVNVSSAAFDPPDLTGQSASAQTVTASPGTYVGWRFYANDTYGNIGSIDIQTFTVTDSTLPQSNTPMSNNTAVLQNDAVTFTANWSDNSELSSWVFSWDASGSWENVSNGSLSGSLDNSTVVRTITKRPPDPINWRFWVNDSSDNWNVSVSTVLNYDKDYGAPNYSNIVKNESTVTLYENVMFNTTWIDESALDFWIFSWNASGSWQNISNSSFSGRNATASTVQNVTAAVGTYVGWKFYVNDTSVSLNPNGNWNETPIQTFTVAAPADSEAPKWQDAWTNDSSIDNGNYVNFVVNWTDNVGLGAWNFSWNDSGSWVNVSSGTLNGFTANSSVNLTVTSAEGSYVGWRFWANDSSGNMNSSDIQTFSVIDNTVPQWSNVSKNTTYTLQNEHVLFNATWTDNVGLSAWNFSWNNSGSWANASSGIFAGRNYSNATLMVTASEGNYIAWRLWANDTSGNINATDIQYFNVNDTTTPVWTNATTNDTDILTNDHVLFNASWTDNVGLSSFKFEWNNSGSWSNDSSGPLSGLADFSNLSTTVTAGGGSYIGWRIWVNDSWDNWNVTSIQTFTVTDSSGPDYSNVSVNDSNVEQNDHVMFNATWTDDVGLSAWNFSWNDSGSWVNSSNGSFSLTGNYSNVSITVTSAAGTYIGWRFYANDTSGNINSTPIQTFTVGENPPKWSNPKTNDSLIRYLDYVMFNATWTDDTALSSWIFEWNDTGTWANVSNASLSGTEDNSSTNQQVTAIEQSDVHWRFWANDTSNQWNVTETQILVIPSDPPDWSNPSKNDSDIQQNDYVQFSMDWEDEVTNLQDWIFSWNDSGSWVNVTQQTFDPQDLTGTSTHALIVTNSSGNYIGWRFYAFDQQVNTNVSDIQYFTIGADSELPNPSSPAKNDSDILTNEEVQFNMSWSDNVGLSSWIFEWNNSGSWVNSTNGTFTGVSNKSVTVVNITAATSTYIGWRFWANDTTNNWNVSPIETFNISGDGTLPHPLTGTQSINNSAPLQNEHVLFTHDWSDETALSHWIFSWNDSGSWVNISNGGLSGSLNTSASDQTVTATSGTNVGWRFYVNDTSNNWNSSIIYNFTVTTDSELPQANDPINNDSTVVQSDSVQFTAAWTDNVGLSGWQFEWNVTGIWTNASNGTLSGLSDNSTTILEVTNSSGNYIGYRFWANDSTNNWNVSKTQYLTIAADSYPPIPSDIQKNDSSIDPNDAVMFNTTWTDNAGLSAWNFSWNDSGSWVNISSGPFSGTSNNSGTTQTVTSAAGVLVAWRFHANDTSGVHGSTAIQTFIVSEEATQGSNITCNYACYTVNTTSDTGDPRTYCQSVNAPNEKDVVSTYYTINREGKTETIKIYLWRKL